MVASSYRKLPLLKDRVKTVIESLGCMPVVIENHLYSKTVMESFRWLPLVTAVSFSSGSTITPKLSRTVHRLWYVIWTKMLQSLFINFIWPLADRSTGKMWLYQDKYPEFDMHFRWSLLVYTAQSWTRPCPLIALSSLLALTHSSQSMEEGASLSLEKKRYHENSFVLNYFVFYIYFFRV